MNGPGTPSHGSKQFERPMSNPLKYLTAASIIYLFSAALGTWVAFNHNLTANFGGFLNGQNVIRDFLTLNGTALSPPLPLMLLQLVFTLLTVRSTLHRRAGVIGLTAIGAVYTIGQLGEPIVLRLIRPSSFDFVQAAILVMSLAASVTIFIVGAQVWRAYKPSKGTAG
jgi:hypothetical protein